jgi:23S rRNA (uracil1939-C5)-methyltransferase
MTTAVSGLTIAHIGTDGDGVAAGPDGQPIYIPFALPGEVIANGEITQLSAERVVPLCPHFETCGGCVAQHMGPRVYANWKHDLVVQAFRHHKLEPTVEPLITVAPYSRRRASFSVVQSVGQSPRLGFHKRRDASVFAVDACPVITPRMLAALPLLSQIVARLNGANADTRVAVADFEGGLDVCIDGPKVPAAADARAWLAAKSGEARLARLTINGEPIIELATVRIPGTAGQLHPLPGSFFQAVAEAEHAIVAAVIAGLPKKPKRIADLFAGLGTLTLPLARHAPVLAADSDKSFLEALAIAVRHGQGLKPVTTKLRDLSREPLSSKELEGCDTVVVDPPRAGARAQVEVLARSKVQTVILVSCNPATLARDARSLVDGGFTLTRVTPIDQFVWTNHVEVVAVLKR